LPPAKRRAYDGAVSGRVEVGQPIVTARLIVRAWCPDDGAATASLLSESRVARWYTEGGPRAWTHSGVQSEWSRPSPPACVLAGVRRDAGDLAGVARVVAGALDYAVVPSLWGRGYGGELAAAAVAWAARELGLRELVADVADANVASHRILRAIGFVPAPLVAGRYQWRRDT
jgi:RimJ/RimL family protein N-acetyltransferase